MKYTAEKIAAMTPAEQLALLRHCDLIDLREECKNDPAKLIDQTKCVDTETGDEFEFHLTDPESGWYWQREVLDWWINEPKTVVLKARQIGITWLASGYALWHLLYRPGTRCLVVSINQTEAHKVVRRIWSQFESLPSELRNGVEVLKPARGNPPSDLIEVRHRDGKMSSIVGLPSTPKAGHGETAALVILDEFARQDYARDTWKAAIPTASKGGRVVVISTGNGISTGEGEGNYFHHLWSNHTDLNIGRKFLRWDMHPDRDERWYDLNARSLPSADRGEQYPRNEREAFILTGTPYFDMQSVEWYRDNGVEQPELVGMFEETERARATWVANDKGWISVYRRPVEGHKYAIGADSATGKGKDYSAAYVIDLSNMELVAQFHGKLDADRYATQLHYLGKWFNHALIAVEDAGGFGDAVTISLRHDKTGRPAYGHLYRHRQLSRPDQAEHAPYGFPINTKTRPQVIKQLAAAIRERSLPYMPDRLLTEVETFVHRDTGTSPAANDGCNDDCVMAAAVALEMYAQRGEHPDRHRSTSTRRKPFMYGFERDRLERRRPIAA